MAKLIEIKRFSKKGWAKVIVDGFELTGVCNVATSVRPNDLDKVVIELYTDKFIIKNEGDE